MSLYIYACSAESSTVNGLENEQGKGRTEALYYNLPPARMYQVLTGVDPSSSLDEVASMNSGSSHHRERRPFLQSSILSMPVDFLLMLCLHLLPSKGQGPIFQTTAHQGGFPTGHETTIALQSIHRFTSNQKRPKGNGAMTRPQKSAKSTSNRYVKQLVLGLSSRVSTLSIIGHASGRHHRSCKIDKTFVPPRIHAYQVSLSTCDGPPLCSSWRPG